MDRLDRSKERKWPMATQRSRRQRELRCRMRTASLGYPLNLASPGCSAWQAARTAVVRSSKVTRSAALVGLRRQRHHRSGSESQPLPRHHRNHLSRSRAWLAHSPPMSHPPSRSQAQSCGCQELDGSCAGVRRPLSSHRCCRGHKPALSESRSPPAQGAVLPCSSWSSRRSRLGSAGRQHGGIVETASAWLGGRCRRAVDLRCDELVRSEPASERRPRGADQRRSRPLPIHRWRRSHVGVRCSCLPSTPPALTAAKRNANKHLSKLPPPAARRHRVLSYMWDRGGDGPGRERDSPVLLGRVLEKRRAQEFVSQLRKAASSRRSSPALDVARLA